MATGWLLQIITFHNHHKNLWPNLPETDYLHADINSESAPPQDFLHLPALFCLKQKPAKKYDVEMYLFGIAFERNTRSIPISKSGWDAAEQKLNSLSMKWINSRESTNVDDRRGMSGGGKVAAGGGILGLIIYVVYSFLGGGGVDTSEIQRRMNEPGQTTEMTPEQQAADDERAKFVKVVLAETEDVWNKLFREEGKTYQEPVLVLYRDQVETACGFGTAATGPFYCPGDTKLYIDLSFYEDLQNKLNAPGDFPMAYVVAHEVGHHIQRLNGISQKMSRLQQSLSEAEYNHYSVMMELQADFLAGVWAHHAQAMKNILDPGDIEEALNAANQIGDDRLQQRSGGRVVPDAFTHGTSAQRMYWFKKGYETGDVRQGDTFNDPSLR
jgi:predicted metalloprotease